MVAINRLDTLNYRVFVKKVQNTCAVGHQCVDLLFSGGRNLDGCDWILELITCGREGGVT
jgi:hypothetical protein